MRTRAQHFIQAFPVLHARASEYGLLQAESPRVLAASARTSATADGPESRKRRRGDGEELEQSDDEEEWVNEDWSTSLQ